MTGLRRVCVQKASLSTPCSLHRQNTPTPVVSLLAFPGLGEDSESISHHPKVLTSLHRRAPCLDSSIATSHVLPKNRERKHCGVAENREAVAAVARGRSYGIEYYWPITPQPSLGVTKTKDSATPPMETPSQTATPLIPMKAASRR